MVSSVCPWKQGKSYEDEATGAAVCEFVLTLTDDMRDRGGKWAPGGEYKCEAIYCVKVEAEKLTTTLTVTNTGDETIEGQQALFHTYYAIEDLCTHDGNPLAFDRNDRPSKLDGYEIECPRHGGRFDVRTGDATRSPANIDVPWFEVRIQDGNIEILV